MFQLIVLNNFLLTKGCFSSSVLGLDHANFTFSAIFKLVLFLKWKEGVQMVKLCVRKEAFKP